MSETNIKRGWWWPPDSHKAHYFKVEDGAAGAIAECRKYLMVRGANVLRREMEDFDDDLKTNCTACKKLVKEIRNHERET